MEFNRVTIPVVKLMQDLMFKSPFSTVKTSMVYPPISTTLSLDTSL